MPKLLVIDTETGGIDASKDSILSLGAIVWDDGRLGPEFNVLIAEPEISVTSEAMAVNRIDLSKHLRSAVPPNEAIAKFESFAIGAFAQELASDNKIVLCGHNAGFDTSFLKRLYKLAGRSFERYFSHRVVDTASVLQFLALTGILPTAAASSTAAFSYFDIEVPLRDRHTALGDARATAQLLASLIALLRRDLPQKTSIAQ